MNSAKNLTDWIFWARIRRLVGWRSIRFTRTQWSEIPNSANRTLRRFCLCVTRRSLYLIYIEFINSFSPCLSLSLPVFGGTLVLSPFIFYVIQIPYRRRTSRMNKWRSKCGNVTHREMCISFFILYSFGCTHSHSVEMRGVILGAAAVCVIIIIIIAYHSLRSLALPRSELSHFVFYALRTTNRIESDRIE